MKSYSSAGAAALGQQRWGSSAKSAEVAREALDKVRAKTNEAAQGS